MKIFTKITPGFFKKLLLISLVASLSIPAVAQEICTTYSIDLKNNKKRVFSNISLVTGWLRTETIKITDFPEEGFFHIKTLVHYNSENEQLNESFYVLVNNSLPRYPQDPNITTDSTTYKIVPDVPEATFDEYIDQDAGLFYFEKGTNIIEIHHYKTIAETFPQFVVYYDTTDNAETPGVNSGDSLGGEKRAESVEVFFIKMVSNLCDNDLQLTSESNFTFNCEDSIGQLSARLQIAEEQQRLFNVSEIDSLVLKTIMPEGIDVDTTKLGAWVPQKIDSLSLYSFTWIPRPEDYADVLTFDQTLTLNLKFSQLDSSVGLKINSQLFTKFDVQIDNQIIRDSLELKPECIPPQYDLSIKKQGNWLPAPDHESIDYRIIVRNEGPESVTSFSIRDTLDAKLSATLFNFPPDSVTNNVFFWQQNNLLLPNDSLILTYHAQIRESANFRQSLLLENIVMVSAEFDTNPFNNADSTLHVFYPVDLSVSHTAAADTFCLQDTVRYHFSVFNLSQISAYNVKLQAELVANLKVVNSNFDLKTDSTGTTQVWQVALDSIAGNSEKTYFINAVLASDFAGSLPSSATVLVKNDSLSSNDSATLSVIFKECDDTPPPNFTDLRVVKNALVDTLRNGEEINYQIDVSNLGPDSTDRFYLVENWPAEIINRKYASPQSHFSVNDDTIRWADFTLLSGESITLQVSGEISVSDTSRFHDLQNFVTVFSPVDTIFSNNQDSAAVTVRPGSVPPLRNYADLQVTKTALKDTLRNGEEINYQIEVSNLGPDSTDQFYLLENWPDEILNRNYASTQSNFNVSGDTIRWADFTLLSGESVTLQVSGEISVSDTSRFHDLQNFVTVFSPVDTIFSNNQDSAAVTVRPGSVPPLRNYADLQVTKTALKDTLRNGEEINYQIEVSNLGPDSTDQFYLLENWPDEITNRNYASVQTNFSVSGDTIRWAEFTLLSGETITLQVSGEISVSDTSQFQDLQNFVTVFSPVDTIFSNNQDSAAIIIRPGFETPDFTDLAIRKRISRQSGKIGDSVEFELEVTNNGPASVNYFEVTDTASVYFELGDYSVQPDVLTNNVARWAFNRQFDAGDKIFINYSARILPNIPVLPDSLLNSASVFASEDQIPGNNHSHAGMLVTCGIDCFLDKNVYAPAVDSDLEINFEICLTEWVRIKIYDLVGTHVTTVTEGVFSAGVPHKVYWNGFVSSGKKMGSGAYVLIIHTVDEHCKLKFLLVQ
ncbi:MAG: hypothetical protein DWQ05_18750 [Calditrichaeota bacterium]|nr:MAG: hypothetical protein DWQ05_18750 [Calditrichota bacterium]